MRSEFSTAFQVFCQPAKNHQEQLSIYILRIAHEYVVYDAARRQNNTWL